MRYYLGLDNGGTTTKAALFNRNGTECAVCRVDTAALKPRPGFMERDMEQMWQDNCAVIRGVMQKAGIRPEQIAGVGVCGHGKGLYLWGEDGKPAGNGILSTDNRAYDYPLRWQQDGTEEQAFALSCQHILSCQSVSLLAWLRDHEKRTWENIRWVFSCKDYVRFRLTGRAQAELTDCSGNGLLNLHTRSYDPQLLQLFGLEAIGYALPPLCTATEICGTVSEEAAAACGLAAGTPVIGGMFDIDACALAVGVLDERNICMIAGTWSINEYVRRTPVMDGSVRMNSLFCLPEYYLIEESSPTSAGNNEWFLQQMLPELRQQAAAEGRSIYEILNAWVTDIPPETFVPVFLPFLMASNVHPNAKAAFVGMSANHTRRHLLRSVYEGIVFCHKMHLDRLMQSRSGPPEAIRVAGGAARSAVWTQMFADVLKLPVQTVLANETGALGCAIAVAAAVGDYADLSAAARGMCKVAQCVQPDPEKAGIYAEKYALYCKTIECLDPLWEQMQQLIERGTGETP